MSPRVKRVSCCEKHYEKSITKEDIFGFSVFMNTRVVVLFVVAWLRAVLNWVAGALWLEARRVSCENDDVGCLCCLAFWDGVASVCMLL